MKISRKNIFLFHFWFCFFHAQESWNILIKLLAGRSVLPKTLFSLLSTLRIWINSSSMTNKISCHTDLVCSIFTTRAFNSKPDYFFAFCCWDEFDKPNIQCYKTRLLILLLHFALGKVHNRILLNFTFTSHKKFNCHSREYNSNSIDVVKLFIFLFVLHFRLPNFSFLRVSKFLKILFSVLQKLI